jgi:hypothetical protein
MYKDVLNDLRESALVISTDASLSDVEGQSIGNGRYASLYLMSS